LGNRGREVKFKEGGFKVCRWNVSNCKIIGWI